MEEVPEMLVEEAAVLSLEEVEASAVALSSEEVAAQEEAVVEADQTAVEQDMAAFEEEQDKASAEQDTVVEALVAAPSVFPSLPFYDELTSAPSAT